MTDLSVNLNHLEDMTEDRTVRLPTTTPLAARPHRAVIWRNGSEKVVVRVTAAPTTPPGQISYSLFERLGGTGQDQIQCHYREASFWDLLRYDQSARRGFYVAILGTVVAAVTAWLTIDKAASSESEARWILSAGVFIIGLVIIVLKLRAELEDLGP